MSTTLIRETPRILDMISAKVRSGVWKALLRGYGAPYDRPDLIRMSGGFRIRDSDALIEKVTSESQPRGAAHFAWRSASRSKALKWFLQRLADPGTQARLLQW